VSWAICAGSGALPWAELVARLTGPEADRSEWNCDKAADARASYWPASLLTIGASASAESAPTTKYE
jgi:hypothetical protein